MTYERSENVALSEQVLRGGAGLIMMEAVLLGAALTPAVTAGLTLSAAYLLFTAFTGWDPLCALIRGQQRSVQASKSRAMALPAPTGAGRSQVHKKAA